MNQPKDPTARIPFDPAWMTNLTRAPEAGIVKPVPVPPATPKKFPAVADAPVAADALVAADANPLVPVVGTSGASTVSERPPLLPAEARSASNALANERLPVFDWVDGYVVSQKHSKSYVVTSTKGYKEVLFIGSPELNARIRAHFRNKRNQPLKQRELDDLNGELRSDAEEFGVHLELYPRVHPLDGGGVELDLNDGKGTTVQLTADGVKVLTGTSNTLFFRSASALSLPLPADHGDFSLLRDYVNLEQYAFLLYIGWVTFTIANPKVEATKYLFLVIKGTQGSGKTFASKTTQRVIDPNAVSVQMLPGSPRELAIILQAAHLIVVDNLRDLTTTISDTLCIAATGGSLPSRKLYTDDEQKALFLHGAMIFNGIHPFMGQSDFADRCLMLDLDSIPHEKRKSETQMLEKFESDRPVILRGLYDLIAGILRALPDAEISHPARMLDFCKWLSAMEIALGLGTGSLQKQYVDSLKEAQLESLLDNPLAVMIIQFAEEMPKSQWSGTPTKFYDSLTTMAGLNSQRSRAWPPTAASMSKRLHGLQAPLAAQGIFIELERGKDRRIVVQRAPHVQVRMGPGYLDRRFDTGSTTPGGVAADKPKRSSEPDYFELAEKMISEECGDVADPSSGQSNRPFDDTDD